MENQLVIYEPSRLKNGGLLGIFLFSHHDHAVDIRNQKIEIHILTSFFYCSAECERKQ